MPVQVECPSCQTQLRLTDDALGKTVACPKCQATFLAAAPASEQPFDLDAQQSATPNPYQPSAAPLGFPQEPNGVGIPSEDAVKIEAVIKDAGQIVIAVLLCLLCSGFGFLIIGPWYLVRLLQWNKWAAKYPALTTPNAPKSSLSQRFQSSRTRLIIGLAIGSLLFMLFCGGVLLVMGAAPR
ncbi:MAG: MJ0042-type zinc finger domain-containing protein [Rubripirellula sp.]